MGLAASQSGCHWETLRFSQVGWETALVRPEAQTRPGHVLSCQGCARFRFSPVSDLLSYDGFASLPPSRKPLLWVIPLGLWMELVTL